MLNFSCYLRPYDVSYDYTNLPTLTNTANVTDSTKSRKYFKSKVNSRVS